MTDHDPIARILLIVLILMLAAYWLSDAIISDTDTARAIRIEQRLEQCK